jgi:hypothetical protein
MRSWAAFLASLFVLALLGPAPAAAALGSCTSSAPQYHAGMNVSGVGTVFGAQATMTFVSEGLCAENGHTYTSFSSSWTALTPISPTDTYHFDIFQIGLLHCQSCSIFCRVYVLGLDLRARGNVLFLDTARKSHDFCLFGFDGNLRRLSKHS